MPPDQEIANACSHRSEMRIAQDEYLRSRYLAFAAKAAFFPTLAAEGDMGLSSSEIDYDRRFTGGALLTVTMPLFEGGNTLGNIKTTKSIEQQKKDTLDDLARQVEEDVRLALWGLRTNIEQVRAAAQFVMLAKRELMLATDRFKEGVSNNIEVLNAQTALTRARNDYLDALVQYHIARLNMYFARGNADAFYLAPINKQ
jgi:outer membrane protein TolC